MRFDYKTLTAEDGTTVRVGIPAGPMPTDAEIEAYRVAWARVKNREHWKNPVDATITVKDQAEIDTICAAIEFYTATDAGYKILEQTSIGMRVRFTADGYFAGPAGP